MFQRCRECGADSTLESMGKMDFKNKTARVQLADDGAEFNSACFQSSMCARTEDAEIVTPRSDDGCV